MTGAVEFPRIRAGHRAEEVLMQVQLQDDGPVYELVLAPEVARQLARDLALRAAQAQAQADRRRAGR